MVPGLGSRCVTSIPRVRTLNVQGRLEPFVVCITVGKLLADGTVSVPEEFRLWPFNRLLMVRADQRRVFALQQDGNQ